jgi:uncharacterized protein YceK
MKKRFVLLALLVLSLVGCSTLKSWVSPVTKYDQKSYENFTSLKAKTSQFVDLLVPTTDQAKIDEFMLQLGTVYEYEKGKGAGNNETIQQLELFTGRINVFIKEAKASVLVQVYKDAKKETLSRILDILISTEYNRPR